MRRHRGMAVFLISSLLFVLAGCGGGTSAQIGGSPEASAPVSLVMTDTPPVGVSVLSFQVTVSNATLAPGNVSLLSAPVTFEVTRLQTENSLINSQSVTPGSYTGITLTFSSPVMTFQNNTGSTVTVGSASCPNLRICTALLPTLTNSSVSVTVPLIFTANTAAALLVDLNLSDFLTNSAGTMAADAQVANAVSVSSLTASQQGALASLEDVVGVVSSVNSTNGTFQLQNAVGTYNITTGSGASGTAYFNFPSAGACSANFACLANGQIVSVDMDLLATNKLLATNVRFEDPTSSPSEVEGIVVATTNQTAPNQFQMIVLQTTPAGSGPAIGAEVPVAPATGETFDVDALGADSATKAYSFATVGDLLVGQEVQVQEGANSTNVQINAARVLLRSSRVTAQIASGFALGNGTLPPFFANAGISQIPLSAIAPPSLGAYTEIGGTATSIAQIAVGDTVSVRGQLFKNATTYPMVATKIIKH